METRALLPPDLPLMPDRDALAAGLSHLAQVHAAHPAFLRRDERPVVFFWRQQRYSVAQWVGPEKYC